MKYLKTYEHNLTNDDDILGAKIGDSVHLNIDSLSSIQITNKKKYIISNILKGDKKTELSIVDDVDNYLVLKGFKDIIRAHYFTPEIIYITKKYNM